MVLRAFLVILACFFALADAEGSHELKAIQIAGGEDFSFVFFEFFPQETIEYKFEFIHSAFPTLGIGSLSYVSQPLCFRSFSPFLKVYVSLKQKGEVEEDDSMSSMLGFEFLVNEQRITTEISKDFQVSVVRKYPIVFPQNVREGGKFYDAFTQNHLKKNLGFSLVPEQETLEHMAVKTMMRAGTHILTDAIENILGEFVGTNYRAGGENDEYYLSGGVKGDISHTMFIWTHENSKQQQKSHRIKRFSLLLRDAIEAMDSLFHYYATKSHTLKLKDDSQYWLLPIYSIFAKGTANWHNRAITDVLLRKELIKYVIRFEDMILDPVETYRKFLTFVLRVPIERTSIMAKIVDKYEGNKVSSYYKKNTKKDPSESWRKLMTKIKKEDVEMLYESSKEWLRLFGYEKRWKDFVEHGRLNETWITAFDYDYEKVNQKTLEYLLEYKDTRESRCYYQETSGDFFDDFFWENTKTEEELERWKANSSCQVEWPPGLDIEKASLKREEKVGLIQPIRLKPKLFGMWQKGELDYQKYLETNAGNSNKA